MKPTSHNPASPVVPLPAREPQRRRVFYSDVQLARKSRDEAARRSRLAQTTPSPTLILMRSELNALMDLAGLAPRERLFTLLMTRGWTERKIAEGFGLARSTVHQLALRVVRRIREVRRNYPWAGLWEVYQQETSRR